MADHIFDHFVKKGTGVDHIQEPLPLRYGDKFVLHVSTSKIRFVTTGDTVIIENGENGGGRKRKTSLSWNYAKNILTSFVPARVLSHWFVSMDLLIWLYYPRAAAPYYHQNSKKAVGLSDGFLFVGSDFYCFIHELVIVFIKNFLDNEDTELYGVGELFFVVMKR